MDMARFKVVQSLVSACQVVGIALAVMAARLAWRFSPLPSRSSCNLKIACPSCGTTRPRLRRLSRLKLSESRQGLRRPDAASSAEDRGHAAAAEGEGFGKFRPPRAAWAGACCRVLPYGFVRGVSAIWAATLAPVSFFGRGVEPRALFECTAIRGALGISVLTLDYGGIRKVLEAPGRSRRW